MEINNINIIDKKKKGLIKKTFETCKSIASGMGNKKGSSSSSSSSSSSNDDSLAQAMKRKSKSWPRLSSSSSSSSSRSKLSDDDNKCKVVIPQGCFSVYVGEEKQRFVMKTSYLNHPLFKMLLEEAESEYGFNSEGPLSLPCRVHLFLKVLAQMDSQEIPHPLGCSSFVRSPISYHPLTPSRLIAINHF